MIAGIDYQANIEVFLEREELDKLKDSVLEGILIQIDNPKRQGTIKLSINEKRKRENSRGIGLDDKDYWGVKDNFKLELFISQRCYEHLKKAGIVKAMQYVLIANQITIYDRSRVNSRNIFRIKDLEYYIDNKELFKK